MSPLRNVTASKRKSVRCCVCSKRFNPGRRDARYCSPACRQQAHRARAQQDDLRREIEATRRRYWQLVNLLHAHDGKVASHLSQVVDTDGNVFAYDGNPKAFMGCGQWVGQIEPSRAGFTGWGLEAAGPPFSPPPATNYVPCKRKVGAA
jgi:hypothetical protein